MATSPNSLRIVPDCGIFALLEEDHDRIDALLRELRMLLDDGELERAGAYLDDAARALTHHIRFEEEELFPLFDRRTRLAGPTTVMLDEHRRIEAHFRELRIALDGERGDDARKALASLISLLGNHNLKEERILYPKTEAVLSPAERSELVARFTRK